MRIDDDTSASTSAPHAQVAEMRRLFDASFATPVATRDETLTDMLAIRTPSGSYALRTAHSAAILRCPALTTVPGGHPALLGLAGVRGALVAVYRVAGATAARPAPGSGWIALCAEDRSMALHFDALIGFARVTQDAIHRASEGEHEVVDIAGQRCGVLDVAKWVAGITRPQVGQGWMA